MNEKFEQFENMICNADSTDQIFEQTKCIDKQRFDDDEMIINTCLLYLMSQQYCIVQILLLPADEAYAIELMYPNQCQCETVRTRPKRFAIIQCESEGATMYIQEHYNRPVNLE